MSSLFSDSGHEIVTSVLPSFVSSTLHAPASALGLIEGISDGLMGVTKLVNGPLANDPERRERMASGGYVGTAIATGTIGLATAVWQVGLLRGISWISRGLRSPARDALLANLAPPEAYGKAYGIERAGDNAGAVLGPLLAADLVSWVGIRAAMFASVIPGLLAAVAIVVAAAEARKLARPVVRRQAGLRLRELGQTGLPRLLVPIALFELGNMASTMLILRATDVLQHDGWPATTAASLAIVLYAVHNVAASLAALAGGQWIDRGRTRAALVAGSLVYGVAYAAFASPLGGWGWMAMPFALAGVGIGLVETAESAFITQALPDDLRGSGFGLLGGLQAVGDFASTAAVGLLYTAVSPSVAFAYAVIWMVLSAASWLVIGPAAPQPTKRESDIA
ncbi:MAG: MFS transporter [Thermomicrobiales bacterium]